MKKLLCIVLMAIMATKAIQAARNVVLVGGFLYKENEQVFGKIIELAVSIYLWKFGQ